MSPASVVGVRLTLTLATSWLLLSGCGKQGLPTKVVHGTVTAGGQPVETGWVRFVPIKPTQGPASTGRIEDGQYRVESRGGVPLGKHRVEVTAFKKTGRKIKRPSPLEERMIDETVSIVSEKYASPNSPLVFELTDEGDGTFDIELPAVDARGVKKLKLRRSWLTFWF